MFNLPCLFFEQGRRSDHHGQDDKAAPAALLATIESVARDPITTEELERTRFKWLEAWDLQFTDAQQVGVAL